MEFNSNFKREEGILLGIFPHEIWLEILNKLPSSDKEGVINSSLFFHQLLSPQRQYFLFPKVFGVFAVQFESHLHKSFPDEGVTNPIAVTVQRLRSTCKEWRTGIDIFYENPRHPLETKDFDFQDSHIGSWTDLQFRQFSSIGLRSYIDHFTSLTAFNLNLICGRSVDFEFFRSFDTEEDNFYPLIKEFLTHFGHHIWYCRMTIDGPCELLEYYNNVVSILSLMPNLKWFHWKTDMERFDLMRDIPEHSTEWFRRHRKLSLPKLKNLKFFSIGTVHGPFANYILRNYEQLEALEIHNTSSSLMDYQCVKWESVKLPNLKKLSLHISKLEEFDCLERCCPKYSWKLNTLLLRFTWSTHLKWWRIFKFAENWKDTLRIASIGLPIATDEKEYQDLVDNRGRRLNLPNVEYLKLYIENVTGIDFILPMKETLKVLTVCCARKQYFEHLASKFKDALVDNLIIDFKWYQRDTLNIFGNNIWGFFPRLERINVEFGDKDEEGIYRKLTIFRDKNQLVV